MRHIADHLWMASSSVILSCCGNGIVFPYVGLRLNRKQITLNTRCFLRNKMLFVRLELPCMERVSDVCMYILQELVKSHLTFAVREEVNSLKARISELTSRNTRLELENSLLRQHASTDTLATLQQQRCSQGYSPTT